MPAPRFAPRSILALAWAAALTAAVSADATTAVPSSGQKAQDAHGQGSCGTMGPGTGLSGNKGWVVSMLPGKHQFRVRGGVGQVFVTVARQSTVDADAGRPYYIVVEGAGPSPQIEWKVPGRDWAAVSNYFLYPISQ